MIDNFDKAMSFILPNEGGYTEDHAGPTNYGVTLPALRALGDLDDDGFQDGDIDRDGDVDADDIRQMSPRDAKEVYQRIRWDKYGYYNISSPALATKILDLSINMGPTAAHKIAQRTVNHYYNKDILAVDGIIGPRTMTALNRVSGKDLVIGICAMAWDYYKAIIEKHPNYKKYEQGWRNRAFKLPRFA